MREHDEAAVPRILYRLCLHRVRPVGDEADTTGIRAQPRRQAGPRKPEVIDLSSLTPSPPHQEETGQPLHRFIGERDTARPGSLEPCGILDAVTMMECILDIGFS